MLSSERLSEEEKEPWNDLTIWHFSSFCRSKKELAQEKKYQFKYEVVKWFLGLLQRNVFVNDTLWVRILIMAKFEYA